MNQNEIDIFKFGYSECRDVLMRELRTILTMPNPKVALKKLIEELESDAERAHWELIQKEQPGITHEEYEAELEEFGREIRERYYSKAGYLKPRLVRHVKAEDQGDE
jgi:hypothetical protein